MSGIDLKLGEIQATVKEHSAEIVRLRKAKHVHASEIQKHTANFNIFDTKMESSHVQLQTEISGLVTSIGKMNQSIVDLVTFKNTLTGSMKMLKLVATSTTVTAFLYLLNQVFIPFWNKIEPSFLSIF